MGAEAGIEPAFRGLWDLQGRRPFPPQRSSSGGPGGTRTLISWVQTRDPAVERRAHFGEDNGTRTRTPALTTRRLSLRLCPPQSGPLFRTPGLVGSRGFEPRSARSERAASANCATSRNGDHGRTRTALDRLSTCCLCRIGLHGRWSLWVDSNHHLSGQEPGMLRSHYRGEMERMTGFEPVLQGLEGPRATVTPHSLWFGLRVSNPSLRAGNAGCFLPHPGRTDFRH
jgi:hypothetical protein